MGSKLREFMLVFMLHFRGCVRTNKAGMDSLQVRSGRYPCRFATGILKSHPSIEKWMYLGNGYFEVHVVKYRK
jgi:hypothetical protein